MRQLSLILIGLGVLIIGGVLLVVHFNTDNHSGMTTNQTLTTTTNQRSNKKANGKAIV